MPSPTKPHLFTVLLFTLTLLYNSAHAQFVKVDSLSNWKKAFRAGLNLNQASFSSNWQAGGINSFGANAFLNYKLNYKKDKHSWDNEIDLLYGMVNNKGQGFRKTLDRIFIDSKYGRSVSKTWDEFVAVNVQSQFGNGYSYGTDPVTNLPTKTITSGSFSPTYITASLGMEYHPTDYFYVRMAPIAPRVTLVGNVKNIVTASDDPITGIPANPKPYGVNSSGARYEMGFQLLSEFNHDIAKNINLKVRYVMYADYGTLALKTIDHRVDMNLTAKVNKFINVSLGAILLYDYDQNSGLQLSQAFSLGVLYTFQNFADKK